MENKSTSAYSDILGGTRMWALWMRLGWEDTKLRYRRSVLGPLWLTLGTGLMVMGMGFIWSILWGMKISEYFPYLTAGFITWQLIMSAVSEGARTYSDQAGLIHSLPLPLTVHSFRLSIKLMMGFAHNLLVFIVVALIFQVPVTIWTLALFPGLILIYVNCLWASILLGMIGVRYRDVANILDVVMGLLVFVTPIVWRAEMLGSKRIIANLNPFTHYLSIIRSPLLGQAPETMSYVVVLAITVVGCILALITFKRYRGRVAFWV